MDHLCDQYLWWINFNFLWLVILRYVHKCFSFLWKKKFLMKVFLSKYVKASTLYVIIGLLPSTINFLLLPVYLRYISPEEYGYLALLNVYLILFSAFACLQLNVSGGTQYFSKGINKESFRVAILSGSVMLIIFWFLIFTLLGNYFFSIYHTDVSFYPLGF